MLAFRPAAGIPSGSGGGDAAARAPSTARPAADGQGPQTKAAPPPRSGDSGVGEPVSAEAPPGEPASQPVEPGGWHRLVEALPLAGMSRQYALHCALARQEGARFELVLEQEVEHLHNPKWEQALKEALESHLGHAIQLSVTVGQALAATPRKLQEQQAAERQRQAEQAIAEDPRLNALLERFDGEVDADSIRPV